MKSRIQKNLLQRSAALAVAMAIASPASHAGAPSSYPAQERSPDIFVQSLFHRPAQKILLEQVQALLEKSQDLKPLNQTFPGMTSFSFPIDAGFEGLGRQIVDDIIQTDFSKSQINLSMVDLEYSIGEFDAHLSRMTATPDGFDVEISAKISSICASAGQIRLSFKGENPKSFVNKIWLSLEQPSLSMPNPSFLNLKLKYRLKIASDQSIVVESHPDNQNQFKEISIAEMQNAAQLDFGVIRTTQLAVEVGGRRLYKSDNGLRKAVELRKAQIGKMIFSPLANLTKDLNAQIESQLAGIKLPTALPLTIGSTKSTIRFHSLSSIETPNGARNQLKLAVDADFGDSANRRVPVALSDAATQQIAETIEKDEATTVVSLSQDFINRSIREFLIPLLKEHLPSDFELGPKQIFLALERKSDKYSLGAVVLDLIINLGDIPSAVLAKKRLRIPIVMYPKLSTTYENDVPVIHFKMAAADISDETLRTGTLGVKSNVEETSLPWLVTKIIRDELKKLGPKLKGSLPLDAMKGLPLSFVHAKTNGQGRLNLLLDLDQTKSKDTATFWREFPGKLSEWMKN